jgi:hypothetical protein
MMTNETQQAGGVVETLKNSIKFDVIVEKIKNSKELILWAIVYGGVGFATGFIFKHYGRYLIMVLLFVAALVGLQYMGLLDIIINQAKLNELLGLKPSITGSQLLTCWFEWIKSNVLITITFAIGFLLGIRLS